MSGVRLRRCRSVEEWDGIVAEFPAATAYHRWSWLAGEAAVYGWRVLPMIAVRDGRPIGVVPLLVDRGLLRRTPAVPHPYGGPLARPEDLDGVLSALRRERRRRLLVRVTVSFTPDDSAAALPALQRVGWSVLTDRTYTVDLRPVQAEAVDPAVLLSCLHSKRRYRVRRALQAGVAVQAVDRVDDLLLRTMQDAYRAHGGRAAVPPALVPWVNGLLADGTALAVEARRGDERLGVLVALRGPTVLGWLGGALPAGRPLDAGTALYHEMLRRAAAEGFERLDLVGHVDDGVAAFKRSLGAEQVTFVEGTDAALVLRAAKAVVGIARRVRPARPGRAGATRGGAVRRTPAQVAPRSA